MKQLIQCCGRQQYNSVSTYKTLWQLQTVRIARLVCSRKKPQDHWFIIRVWMYCVRHKEGKYQEKDELQDIQGHHGFIR